MTSPGCSVRWPVRFTASSSAASRNAAMTSRRIYWPPNRPKPSPGGPCPAGRRCRAPPVVAPPSSKAIRSTPITSSTPTTGMASSVMSLWHAIPGRQGGESAARLRAGGFIPMTLTREQVPDRVSALLEGHPTRWVASAIALGDYDGRERTLEVFEADAREQRALLRRLRDVRPDIDARCLRKMRIGR
jgi:hypothetical protein